MNKFDVMIDNEPETVQESGACFHANAEVERILAK